MANSASNPEFQVSQTFSRYLASELDALAAQLAFEQERQNAEMFGRAGGRPGLLDWLGSGSLMLNNAEALP